MNKYLYVIITAFLFSSTYAEDAFLKQLQQELHKRGDPWIAGETSVSKLTPEQQKSLFSIITPETIPERGIAELHQRVPVKALPTYLDWRTVDGQNWMTHPHNQDSPSTCGSCWAFANVGQFEARLNIANGLPNYDLDLSEQFQMACDANNNGCHGGSIITAADFTVGTGIPDEACYTYQANDLPCGNRCSDWASRVHTAKSSGSSSTSSEYKTAIYDGPVAGSFILGKDFLYYKGGNYEPIMGEKMAAHGMTVCGWSDATQYWLIKNSWGEDWGDRGFGWVGPTTLQYISWNVTNDIAVPAILIKDKKINDTADGIWDAGETADIIISLRNWGANATNVQGTLSVVTGGSYLTILNGTSNFGAIGKKEIVGNSSNAFKVSSDFATPSPYTAQFKLHITADGGYSKDITFDMVIGIPTNFKLPTNISSIYGLAFDGLFLWATDYNQTSIYKLSQQGYLMAEIPAPNGLKCTGLAWDNGNLWVQNESSKKIYKVNPANGQIITNFNSPATSTPTGLAFDGTNLWVADRDGYKIYKITTSGTLVTSFNVPVTPQVLYGPRELGFDPRGPDSGSLVLYMTHYHQTTEGVNILDSVAVWEIRRTGALVGNNHFRSPDTNGRAVEVNPVSGKYWVNTLVPNKIYVVKGFNEVAVEEATPKEMEFISISPNPSERLVSFKFYILSEKKISINVYDVVGRSVYKLEQIFKPGEHNVDWNCKKMHAGAYLCVIKAGVLKETKKLMILK